jgi:hypothetical protein
MTALIKNVIVVSIGTVICAALVLFLVKPMVSDVDSFDQALLAKKADVINMQEQVQSYQKAHSDLNLATDKQEILDAILVKEDLVKVVKEIEAAAAATGSDEEIKISDPYGVGRGVSASVGGKAGTTQIPGLIGVTMIPYTLTIHSDNYSNLTDFLGYMEHLPSFSEIVDLQLSSEGDDQSGAHTGKIMANIDGVFFVKNDQTK